MRLAPGGAGLHDPVELEGEVGQRLPDAVVEVAGDAGALLVGAHRAETSEPSGVVDGEGGGLHEASQELDIAAGEVVGVGVLDGQESDDRPTGRQHGVEPRRGAGREPRATVGEQVLLAHQAAEAGGAGERAREVLLGDHVGRAGALTPEEVPATVRVVQHQDGHRVEHEELPELLHGGVEHLVDVERGRKGLGDVVQLVQQGVGIGEATEAIHGEDLPLVGLARHAAGVAGHHGDEEHLHAPLDRGAGVVLDEGQVPRAQGSVTATSDTTAMRRPNPNPRANPATATAVSSENASGDSQ